MTREAVAALEEFAALQHHWGDAYEITHDAAGWHAQRRDGARGPLDAPGPVELHDTIRADYAARPVPRDFDPGERG
jgi:hypothetical protein